MDYLKEYKTEELMEMMQETKIDYHRVDRNCWYDKIIIRESKFIAIRDILDDRKTPLTDVERKLF